MLDRLSSQNSKIAYARALIDFLDWYDGQRRPVLTKGVVQRYRATLLDADLAPSSVNQKLSAIRALAAEAADNGLLDRATAATGSGDGATPGAAAVAPAPAPNAGPARWSLKTDRSG